jgi:hypothetical protein
MLPMLGAPPLRRSPFRAASTTSAATANTSRTSASAGQRPAAGAVDEPHRAAQFGRGTLSWHSSQECVRSHLSRVIKREQAARRPRRCGLRNVRFRPLLAIAQIGRACSADSESGCVVQGPIIARRRRGIATSRESTTTGRRPTPASSHHQTSPRAGSAVTTRRQPFGTRRGHPFVVRVDWDAVVHDEQVLLIGLPMAHGHRFARPKHERLTPSCSSCRSPSKSSATTQTSPRPST